jgi:hypothetical protein
MLRNLLPGCRYRSVLEALGLSSSTAMKRTEKEKKAIIYVFNDSQVIKIIKCFNFFFYRNYS